MVTSDQFRSFRSNLDHFFGGFSIGLGSEIHGDLGYAHFRKAPNGYRTPFRITYVLNPADASST
jgi:hypothetical protein